MAVQLFTVHVQMKDQSQPLVYEDVLNTYTKDGLFCVYVLGDEVFKHPVGNIWRIKESYGRHLSEKEK